MKQVTVVLQVAITMEVPENMDLNSIPAIVTKETTWDVTCDNSNVNLVEVSDVLEITSLTEAPIEPTKKEKRMPKKTTSWEYRVYNSQDAFDSVSCAWHDSGFSKRDAIYEAKLYVKKYYRDGMIVKIQTSDLEKIEMYSPSNRFGNIIFNKN